MPTSSPSPLRRLFLASAIVFVVSTALLVCGAPLPAVPLPQDAPRSAPVVTKIEPPNWWVGLTPEVMLQLTGQNLKATRVACNLPSLHVTRIQANGGGRYLFVWLKIGADTKSGTAVCRIQTPAGMTSFELPLAARAPAAGKFQGLTVDDALYLIMPARFADGDPTNDQPPQSPGTYDRGKPRAYHGGDLKSGRAASPSTR